MTARSVLITGAGGAIGRAVALRFARDGDAVLCADLDLASAQETATLVGAAGGTGHPHGLDVTDEQSCAAAVAEARTRFGGLDVLANIAGTGAMSHTHEISLDAWETTMRVNVTGTFLMCRAAIPLLLERRGCIVNLASSGGLRPTPYNAAYCTSKAAVVMLTKTIAVEYASRGLRASCVAPGSVATPFLGRFIPPEGADMALLARQAPPAGRLITADEVAAAFAHLASADAVNITGSTLVIDGGSTA